MFVDGAGQGLAQLNRESIRVANSTDQRLLRPHSCAVSPRGWSVARAAVDWVDEVVAFEIERDVIMSAHANRKLLDAKKIADSTAMTKIDAECNLLIDRVPDQMNWHRLDQFYAFGKCRSEKLTLAQFCNQVRGYFRLSRTRPVPPINWTGAIRPIARDIRTLARVSHQLGSEIAQQWAIIGET
jgi:hypothetical protein